MTHFVPTLALNTYFKHLKDKPTSSHTTHAYLCQKPHRLSLTFFSIKTRITALFQSLLNPKRCNTCFHAPWQIGKQYITSFTSFCKLRAQHYTLFFYDAFVPTLALNTSKITKYPPTPRTHTFAKNHTDSL
ncbi:hypothetical protein O97_00097 [Bartonella henselae str. Zeus]|nr:hypothetical protein Q653_00490 [Bartonella henselae JK 42]ETS12980.1 hypothetical protein Q652_00623 [Bartonella henselae JK 41]KEC59009.1 hypothetical protein O97_00097 [Bartonella henselae str. Zeus]KEC60465.1 hypothetical protein O95_00366 [Bartonella henselae JK 53]